MVGLDGFNFEILGVPEPLLGRHAANVFAPLGGQPSDAICILTDIGRQSLNRMPVEIFRIGVFSFAVGTGGYDPGDPLVATQPDQFAVELENKVFPVGMGAYEPVDRVERPNETGISFLCRIETDEALVGLGELGIFAQILQSPVPEEVGTWFMFGLMHFPMECKHMKKVCGYRALFQGAG